MSALCFDDCTDVIHRHREDDDAPLHVSVEDIREEFAALRGIAEDLTNFARAYLLFHSVEPWTAEKAAEWNRLIGTTDATTKAMGDRARALLAELEEVSR